jgi:hypothetical protein
LLFYSASRWHTALFPRWLNAAQQGVEPDCQQLASIDLGCRLAAYWVGRVGSGQRCCWPLNADPLARPREAIAGIGDSTLRDRITDALSNALQPLPHVLRMGERERRL